MAITKKVEDDQIEIVGEYKVLQIRQITIIEEDGVELSRNYHRRVVTPGADVSNETDEIKALVNLYHTDELTEKYKEFSSNNSPAG